jgi:hypothetical protein
MKRSPINVHDRMLPELSRPRDRSGAFGTPRILPALIGRSAHRTGSRARRGPA